MNPTRILILQPGTTAPGVRRRFGDFEAWFRQALAEEAIEWTVLRPDLGDELPERGAFDAVLVTGSPASVTSRAPWIEKAAAWTRRTVERGTPFLGVCFGHQLLGRAFGARVERNPLGFEFGTAEVQLTAAGERDALFAGLARPLKFQQTHEDMVVSPGDGGALRVLAGNAHCAVQALAVGERARGVQFHPEMTAAIIDALGEELALRPPRLEDAPDGPRLLRNFVGALLRGR